MKARIWCQHNNYGLTRDFQVVQPILEACGYEVERVGPNKPAKGKTDIAIHLEHIYPRNLALSDFNIAVPNVEWCPGSMLTAMRRCQLVLSKTMDAADCLARAGIENVMTGWTSPDVYAHDVPREKKMVHLAGRSPLKSTNTVVAAMRLIPDIPLTIYRPLQTAGIPPNVTHVQRHVLDIKPIINGALIHVLPSQYEGFGHAINEAMCVGANIVTTNHAPMNTFMSEYLCPASGYKRQGIVNMATLNPEHLAQTIRQGWEEVTGPNLEARKEWQRRDEAFNLTFTEVIRAI